MNTKRDKLIEKIEDLLLKYDAYLKVSEQIGSRPTIILGFYGKYHYISQTEIEEERKIDLGPLIDGY